MNTSQGKLTVGEQVKFLGFDDPENLPENANLLNIGDTYQIEEVIAGSEELLPVYLLSVDGEKVEVFEGEIVPSASKKVSSVTSRKSSPKETSAAASKKVTAKKAVSKKVTSKKVTSKKASSKKVVTKKVSPTKVTSKKKVATKKVTGSKVASKVSTKKAITTKKTEEEHVTPEVFSDPDLRGLEILTEKQQDADILQAIRKMTPSELMESAAELAKETVSNEYRLGGLLYNIAITKCYQEKYPNPRGFEAFLNEELQTTYRTARHHIRIYCVFSKYSPKNSGSVIREIGSSKAGILTRAMNKNNAKELIKLARESDTVESLADTVREMYSAQITPRGKTVRRESIRLRYTPEVSRTLLSYMKAAVKQLGVESIEEAVEHIVTEWASENLDVSLTTASTKVS